MLLTVRSGCASAWRFANCPTSRSPLLLNPTTEGQRRLPSERVITVASFPSTTATTVYNAGTGQPWAGTESTGSSAYDTAAVATSDTITATGTVSYTFFTNGTCSGNGAPAGGGSLDGAFSSV